MINHEQINHLNINKEYTNSKKNNLHGNAIYSISTKYRLKCITFVYYKNHDKWFLIIINIMFYKGNYHLVI
jgi:hypothetical protein